MEDLHRLRLVKLGLFWLRLKQKPYVDKNFYQYQTPGAKYWVIREKYEHRDRYEYRDVMITDALIDMGFLQNYTFLDETGRKNIPQHVRMNIVYGYGSQRWNFLELLEELQKMSSQDFLRRWGNLDYAREIGTWFYSLTSTQQQQFLLIMGSLAKYWESTGISDSLRIKLTDLAEDIVGKDVESLILTEKNPFSQLPEDAVNIIGSFLSGVSGPLKPSKKHGTDEMMPGQLQKLRGL